MRIRKPPGAVVIAVVVVTSACAVSLLPGARASGTERPGVRWSLVLSGGPWGVVADRAGGVVVADDGSVTAVTRAGTVRWRTRGISVTEAAPALSDHAVLVGGEEGVALLERGDGRVRWHAELPARAPSVALAGGLALVGDDAGTLRALDAGTGAERWRVARDGRLFSGTRVDLTSGTVVASWHGGAKPHVEALDLTSGATRWSAPTGSGAAAPVVAGGAQEGAGGAVGAAGVVVTAAGDGHFSARVEARDLATGAVRWSTAVPASFEEAIEPQVRGSDVVVVDHFGTVTDLGLARGERRWTRALHEPVLASRVAVGGDRVVVTTYGGAVVTLDRASGRVRSRSGVRGLQGYPVSGTLTAWGGSLGYLAGLRLTEPGELVLLHVR